MSEAPGPNELRDPLVRAELRKAGIWIGMVVAVALIYTLAQPLLLILGGFVLATMMDGGTRLLGRVLPIARGWRLAIVLLLVVGFLGWVLYYAGSQLIAQTAQLQVLLQTQSSRLIAYAQSHGMNTGNLEPSRIVDYALGSVGRVTAAVGTVVGGITSIALIFVLGIFFAIEPRLYERGFAWFLPVRERAHFYNTAEAMGHTLRRLMAGRLIGMLTEGVATWILLGLYGIPLAPLLGLITGLLVFIPNIGAIISGVLMVLVGFSLGTDAGLYALGVYVVVQTVDGNIIVPMIARRTVDLAPALVLGAQLLFGALFGILGLALADPMVAMIKIFLEKQASRGSAISAAGPSSTAEPLPPTRPARRAARQPTPRKPAKPNA